MKWLLSAALVAVFTLGLPGVAGAAPEAAPAGSPIPAELRQFIADTDEFKAGPWFTGECADRGGDIGAYISAAFPEESRLLYWTAQTPEEKRAILLAGSTNPADTVRYDAMIAANEEPPVGLLPKVFPAGDSSYRLPVLCAEDAARWATPEWNAWRFVWASEPDAQSLAAMKLRPGADKVPDEAWTDPGKVGGAYDMHAFFLNCDASGAQFADSDQCQQWNEKVADLFAGTANWLDQNTTVGDRLGSLIQSHPGVKVGLAYVKAFAWAVETGPGRLAAVTKFVQDPTTVIDDWANATKDSSIDVSTRVLQGLADTGKFDPMGPEFLRWYAYSTGIGVVVMGFMFLLTVAQAGWRRESMSTVGQDILMWMPLGVLMMLFAPVIALLLTELTNAASDAAAKTGGGDVGTLVTNLEQFAGSLSAPGFPGGVVVGLLMFLLLIVGALSVMFGLLVHQFSLPLLLCAAGIGFGMWVNPKWRKKALTPLYVWLAVLFSKPLLLLMVGVMTGPLSNALVDGAAAVGVNAQLQQLGAVVVGFLLLGVAPWTLLKYAPVLPARSDAASFGSGGGTLAAGVAGGVASSQLLRQVGSHRSHSSSSGAAGGGQNPQWLQQQMNGGAGGSGGGVAQAAGGGSAQGMSQVPATAAKSSSKGAVKGAGHAAAAVASGGTSLAVSAGAAATSAAARLAAQSMNHAKHHLDAAPGEDDR